MEVSFMWENPKILKIELVLIFKNPARHSNKVSKASTAFKGF